MNAATEIMLIEPAQDAVVIDRYSGASDGGLSVLSGVSATPLPNRRPGPFAGAVAWVVAAALSGTGRTLEMETTLSVRGSMSPVAIIDMRFTEGEWIPTLEPVTREQIRSLNALLALPYVNDHDFQYLADE